MNGHVATGASVQISMHLVPLLAGLVLCSAASETAVRSLEAQFAEGVKSRVLTPAFVEHCTKVLEKPATTDKDESVLKEKEAFRASCPKTAMTSRSLDSCRSKIQAIALPISGFS